jgi:hypothetical protein
MFAYDARVYLAQIKNGYKKQNGYNYEEAYFFLLFLLCSLCSHAQGRDTLVVLVDTTASYVKYTETLIPNGFFRYRNAPSVHGKIESRISILDCHYFDGTQDADIAAVFLTKIYKGHYVDIINSEIQIQKKDIKKYNVITSEWIKKEIDRVKLHATFGDMPTSRYVSHFIVFKSELENKNTDSLTMHAAFIDMNQVIE